MSPLAIYAVVGVCVLVFVYGVKLIQERNRGDDPILEIHALMQRGPKKITANLLDGVVVPSIVIGLVILFWPLAFCYQVWDLVRQKPAPIHVGDDEDKEFMVYPENLTEKLTTQQIEERERVTDPLGAVPSKPFGFLNGNWVQFLSELQMGDEVWSFSSRWDNGWKEEIRHGYAIKRLGKVCRFVATDIYIAD